MAQLGRNRYGKAGIRLVRVGRTAAEHEVRDVTIAVALEGDFIEAHVSGDNARVLPTDTMKNSVYALARQHFTGSIEDFALFLSEHFMAAAPISTARVKIQEHVWTRLNEHAFTRAGSTIRTTRVTRTRTASTVKSGVRGLWLLKTTHSEFAGYLKDQFTTLAETRDRVLATVLNAEWKYDEGELDYDAIWQASLGAITDTFAAHHSLSVQHTLYAIGDELLKRSPAIERAFFQLPNKHHLLVDLSAFGMDNRNEVFVAPTEPYGLIEAEVVRDAAGR